MRKPLALRIISSFLFLILFSFGFYLAQHKPLWNDEIYSQTGPIQGQSYSEMLSGKISEGSNTPLFYIIQKTLCRVTQYKLELSGSSNWYVVDNKAQALLRLFPNLYMALALTLVFYFFSRYYSFQAGLYGLLISLSSPMIWRYWTEARPYSLWILLTIVQSILFLMIMREDKKSRNLWIGLMITHVLMAFTAVFSLAQMVVVSILFYGFAWKEKKKVPKSYGIVTLLSIITCLFYYTQAPKYNFWFDPHNPPIKLMLDCFSLEYLWVCGVFGLVFLMFSKNKKIGVCSYFYLLILTSLAALALLIIFIIKAVEYPNGFGVVSRYFLFLTPVAIMATILASIQLWNIFKNNLWMKMNIFIFLAGLLIIRCIKTYLEIYGLAIYWG